MADFVIVGGGVYGAATAWSLARGGASVCVLEHRDVAAGASGGPGRRGVRANGRDVRELPLMHAAYDRWPNLHAELGVADFYERTGHLLLAETARDGDRLRAMAWLQQQHGVPTTLLSGDAAREMEPGLSAGIASALYCPLDGVADHTAVTRAYAQAASRLGTAVKVGCRVSSIEVSGSRARAVLTTGGERIAAEHGVMVLANSEVQSLIRPWITLPVWNETLQVLISEPMAQRPFSRLSGHMSRTVALKLEGADRVMLSGGWPGRWDTQAQRGTTIAESIQGNVQEAVKVYPQLAGLRVEIADAGHQESFSIDGIPIIDTVTGAENVWYATGWCGHGWAIAPIISDLLAGWALNGERPQLLEPFRHERFTKHAG